MYINTQYIQCVHTHCIYMCAHKPVHKYVRVVICSKGCKQVKGTWSKVAWDSMYSFKRWFNIALESWEIFTTGTW